MVSAVGCGGEDEEMAASADSGAFDTAIPDSMSPEDTGAVSEAATDSGTSEDSATDGGSTEPVVKIVPLSTTAHDRFRAVTFDSTGAFYAVGEIADVVIPDSGAATPDVKTVLAKFKADGSLDTTFGTGGVVTKNIIAAKEGEIARGIVVQSSGKIVIAATIDHLGGDARDRDIALVRFAADGSVDTTFGTAGVLTLDLSSGALSGTRFLADSQWSLQQFPDGKLLVAGGLVHESSGAADTDQFLLKLTADGARDTTFGTDGLVIVDIDRRSQSARAATILADGSVVMGGYMTDGDGNTRPAIFKVTAAGVLDGTFGTAGIFNELVLPTSAEAYAVVPQGSSFVTIGYGKIASTDKLDWVSFRLTSAGARDATYGNVESGGKKLLMVDLKNDDNARSMLVLPDERLLFVGGQDQTSTSRTADGAYAIVSKNGDAITKRAVDLGGARDFLWSAALSPSKTSIVMAGIKGANPDVSTENDDAALVIVPVPAP
jgi:uncharacterized delta-60 repeat protein